MPHGAAESRGSQAAVLAGIIHSKKTGDDLKQKIYNLYNNQEAKSVLNEYEWANVRDAKRNFDNEVRHL